MNNIDRRRFLSYACATAVAGAMPPRVFASSDYEVAQYGAQGDGINNDTAAIQKAVDACATAGGGRVLLSAGKTYLSGTIILKSHVDLHLESGATLKMSGERADVAALGALIFAKDAVNISVTGEGTIEGNAYAYNQEKYECGYVFTPSFLGPYNPIDVDVKPEAEAHGRPLVMILVGCEGARLRDFTIRNAPSWTIHPLDCDDLWIDGISILNDLIVPNCDGIDIDHCRNVRISNCNIRAGDDCIVLKTSRNFDQLGPCENITVTNCTLESSSAAIKIEPEGVGAIRHAVFTGCTIKRGNRGIAVNNRDGSLIEDILFSHMVISTERRCYGWWGAGEPIIVSNLPRTAQTTVGPVRGLRFNDMICRSESGIVAYGGPQSPVEDIAFDGVECVISSTSNIPGGKYDLRPGDQFPEQFAHKIAGVWAEHVNGLALHNCSIAWGANPPEYYGPALEANHVKALRLENFTGHAAHPGEPDRLIDGKPYPPKTTPHKRH